jgi:hypothetical protein
MGCARGNSKLTYQGEVAPLVANLTKNALSGDKTISTWDSKFATYPSKELAV